MKKIVIMLMVFVLMLGVLPMSAIIHADASNNVLTYTIENEKVTITGCEKSAVGVLKIPDSIDGYPVTAIGFAAFRECMSLTEVILPESITSIAHMAFYDCWRLERITIPKNVTIIDRSTFYACKALTNVIIPETVTEISDGAFKGCKKLEIVQLPKSIDFIDIEAFFDTGITDVYFDGTDVEREKNLVLETFGNSQLINATWHYAGDINGDGTVTSSDVVAILSILKNNKIADKSADLNQDGKVTLADALNLLKRITM
ncbi:MAG: leucine-rich repeat protein [Clostridia bacterium]|nr:leucine-rich repeat protein [Clostridia bacterium]